jgi:predicted RNase H-like HicB family nuclease
MNPLQHTIKVFIRRGEEFYVAECVEINVVTQGKSLDETIANLQEAVALHLEGEDPKEFGLVAKPALLVSMELDPSYV